MAQRIPIDPDKGLTDLVRQLGDDSKRLLGDEIRLAKTEAAEGLHRVTRGGLWIGVAFATTVVALVAVTLFLATAIGRVVEGHMWVGAMVAAAIDLVFGAWLVRRGLRDFKRPPYSLPETRAGLRVLRGS